MTAASDRCRVATEQLLLALHPTDRGEIIESGNVGDGWIFTFTAHDGESYHVEVCCAGLSDEESEEERDA